MTTENPSSADQQFGIADTGADWDVEQVSAAYHEWRDRGELRDGRRVTILTGRGACEPNETVRVDHVVEVVEPGQSLYVMGPKPIWSEYVNGHLQAAAPEEEVPGDPFAPEEYDGRVLESPGIDANFAPSYYRFPRPGRYEIRWQPGRWRSNRLVITVGDPSESPG